METKDLRILWEDNHLIVCVKPPGVLSQADGKDLPDMLTLLKAYVKERYHKPGNVYIGLIHRLDLNVGGVMAFAKTSKAASRLSESIRGGEFAKRYYAVVNGILPVGEQKRWEDRLDKDEETKTAFVAEKGRGKEAALTFTVLETIAVGGAILSLVDIELHTGRFHQIRIQFASRGFPLYGDQKYGKKLPKGQEEGLGLFAYRLDFQHPVTHSPLSFSLNPQSGVFRLFSRFHETAKTKEGPSL
jgi:23S rRNA pseudouridine1911/1915/1917 synthase